MPPSATKSTPKGKQVLEKIFGLPHPFFDGGSFPTKREAAAMWMWFVENGDFESESKKAKKRKMSPKEKFGLIFAKIYRNSNTLHFNKT